MTNIDPKTVASFGDEWARFDQSKMPTEEILKTFNEYFSVFPWHLLPKDAEGFDMGCGSGRWARLVAPKVGRLNCIDPSDAIEIARSQLRDYPNASFLRGSVDDSGLSKSSQDFGYSLGVLHHVPDTQAAIRSCVDLLKPGAPFLLYLYYAFDNRPIWFKALWMISNIGREVIFRMPAGLKHATTDTIAAFIYLPLARFALICEKIGLNVSNIPLSYYRKHGFYTMRTDARDRFGTPLEQRFTQKEISAMMKEAGLIEIRFSSSAPFWCATGIKSGA